MQCSKCHYEPTLSEMQRSPDNCVRCGRGYADPKSVVPGSIRNRSATFSLVAFVLIIIFAAFYFYHYRQLAAVSESSAKIMRSANGFVAELLDEGVSRNNGEYLSAVPDRIKKLDDLSAEALAIDDSAMPGLGLATSAYVRAYRNLVNMFSDHVRGTMALGVARSELDKFSDFAKSDNGKYLISIDDSLFNSYIEKSLADARSASIGPEAIQKLKDASVAVKIGEQRVGYRNAKERLDGLELAQKRSLQRMGDASSEVNKAGKHVESITGRKMPILEWRLK